MSPSPARKAEGFYWKGFYEYWLGRMEPALDSLERGKVLADSVGNEDLRAYADWMKGWMYYHRGEPEKSREWFRKFSEFRLKAETPDRDLRLLRSSFWLALDDLKEGNLVSAGERLAEVEALAAKLENEPESGAAGYLCVLRAELLLAEGSAEKALIVYQGRKAPSPRFPWMLTTDLLTYDLAYCGDFPARAYARMGRIDKAIVEYERLTVFDPKGDDRHLVRPIFHYNLARLYEEKGQTARALEQYQKFLQIWREADPSLKEAADAGQRAARIEKAAAR
jgi:tetratricopeptide (TPR) repeat protein